VINEVEAAQAKRCSLTLDGDVSLARAAEHATEATALRWLQSFALDGTQREDRRSGMRDQLSTGIREGENVIGDESSPAKHEPGCQRGLSEAAVCEDGYGLVADPDRAPVQQLATTQQRSPRQDTTN
jgi:hypothetical protein